jgi:hypothetical protein
VCARIALRDAASSKREAALKAFDELQAVLENSANDCTDCPAKR